MKSLCGAYDFITSGRLVFVKTGSREGVSRRTSGVVAITTGTTSSMLNVGIRNKLIVIAGIVFFAAFQPSCFAQNQNDDAAKPPAKSADNKTSSKSNEEIPPAVARELDDLKARIADLEALLRAKIAQDNAATSVNTSAPASVAPTSGAPSTVATSAPAPVAPSANGTAANSSDASAQPTGVSINTATAGAAPAVVQDQSKPASTAPSEPFAFADFSWLNGNSREKDLPLDTKFFTPEIRADIDYVYDFNHPSDHTIGGSSEIFRSGEVQVTQLGVGGDFHYDNVRARFMTQFGMYAQTTPRNDGSPAVGQWNLDTAYRYVSEAYGGYHFNVLHGVNVDAGIFMSYIGLFSYYNFDNWAYQPSYVSSNTPWFFNGLRVQVFPTDKLKIEYWYINGWQSYGRFNKWPGMGGQIIYRPNGWLNLVFNNYGMGTDTLGVPGRSRLHADYSVEVKYYDKPENFLDKMAFSLTGDAGCEYGGGVSCYHNSAGGPKQSFLGFMAYDRMWFHNDKFGLTLGGGEMNNPGRYLVLLPPINGADAISGSPYFPEAPGLQFKAWDASTTFDWMPKQYITFRWEYDHRQANVPYFSGPGGITPLGGNTGAPASLVPGFSPDLRKVQSTIEMAILVKF